MTPIELNIVLFAATVIIFAAMGFSASLRQHSARDYFHDKSLSKNAVSLIATNITLGTGLVYLVTGAQHNGLLMLLIPVMTWLGYYLLATYLEKVASLTARTGKNFLASIDGKIAEATGKPSPFAASVSGSLVVVFVLVLAFEIFASAKVVAPFVFKTPDLSSEVALSMIVFCITILYTILGGIGAVFKVDMLQVPLVCVMIPVFLVTAIPNLENPGMVAQRLVSSLKIDGPILAGVTIACINAVITQFYSLLNWGGVSHVELADQQRLLKWVGAGTAVVLTAFVLVGLLHPVEAGGQVWQDVTDAYVALASMTTMQAYISCAILVLGMLSVLLTTTDAVVITAIMFWYDNVAKGDSTSQSSNPGELRRIRRIGALTFAFCFVILMTINYWQPDPFYLLMSMAGGATVFGPMIAVAGWLGSKGESLRVFTPTVVYGFVTLFVFAGAISAIMLAWQSSFVSYVSVTAFALSVVYALVLAFYAMRNPARRQL